MRRALGAAVFWEMLSVMFFGLLLTPVFYVVVRGFSERRRSGIAPAKAVVGELESVRR